ncbi:kinase-like domain-containing protein [Xylariaceae sp. FL0255]|nr:kinase-like domain-containing protein [Xylariaceae sp. FL0255]
MADDIEDLNEYRDGGLAPLAIGDVIANRFEIIHKLGHGGIATVWLCWEIATRKWCAVKVNSAEMSVPDCGDLKAIKLIKENGIDLKQLDENHIFMPLETFWHASYNGEHLCTVMPVLGPRLYEWRQQDVRENPDRINKICHQVVKGLGFLHDNGICHGDFRPQNILMKLKPNALDVLSKKDMVTMLGDPRRVPVYSNESYEQTPEMPPFVTAPASWYHWRNVVTDEIAIVDFGEVYSPKDPPPHYGIPMKYSSPEILFNGKSSGFASDVWSLAVTLLELRLDNYSNNAPCAILRDMERFIGPIPKHYRLGAKRLLAEEFGINKDQEPALYELGSDDENEMLMGSVDAILDKHEEREYRNTDAFSDRLEKKLASEQRYYGEDEHDGHGKKKRTPYIVKYYLPHEEVRVLGGLLHKMLKYDPSERISVSEVLRHPWFKNRNIPKPTLRYNY